MKMYSHSSEKAKLFQFIAIVIMMLAMFTASAQLANVPVTGYNNDLVANGTGATNTATTGSMAGMVTQPTIGVDGVGYTFIDATYKWWSGSVAPTCYLPTGGAIPSALTSGLTYQLQSYTGFNARTIVSNTYAGSVWPTTGSVSLVTPASYSNLYVLYESVMNTAGPTITATVTFTDATTQVFSGNALVNWFTATNVAYTPFISRAQNVAPGTTGACNTGPYLFQLSLALSAGNYAKTVQSISFNWSAATGAAANTIDYFHVLAVGGNTPCTGTPTPGNTLASANPVCSGVNFTLSTQNAASGGSTFQWQSSPDGTTWTNIAGATSATRVGSQTVATYYQCLVTCPTGPSTGTSNPIFVTMSAPNTCYCVPTTTGGTTYYISNFTTTLGTTNINNTSGSSAGYQNFSGTTGMSALPGTVINYSMTVAGGSTYGRAIWLDANQDGTFGAGEQVASSTSYASSPLSGSFTVPAGATPGLTRMRIIASFTPSNPSNACTNTGTGEYEDYAFTVIPLTPCSGTPAPGNTLSTSNPACSGVNFTLSLQNATTGGGVTYQWQSSPDGSTWTNIAGATSSSRVGSQTTATYYQCLVTCSTGPSTGTSTAVYITMNTPTACYCIPTTTGGATYYVSNFTTTLGTTNINNTSVGSATGYQNFSSTASMSAMQGTSVNFTMTIAGGGTYGKAIWIDFNQDGTFAAGEQVASSTAYVASPISGSFTVPLTATTGTTRMRILASFTPNNPSNPCTNSGSGEYEDYAFNVIALPNCTAPPASATASQTVAGSICGSGTKTLVLSGITPASGYTYQWQESVSGGAGTFVNVSTGTGATTNTYTTATLTSSMYYQCEIGCSFGGGTATSSSVLVAVNSAPVLAVTPTTGTSVCSGANVDLTASGANTYSWAVNPGVAGYPVVSMLTTKNNLATVSSRPTSTLASNTAAPNPATVATPSWTYTVTGTAVNGCTATASVVLNVVNTPVVPIQLTYTNAPDPVCAPGTPVTLTVTNPGTIGAGSWIYNWYDQAGTTLLQSTTNTSSTDSYTPSTPAANGNYIYQVKVSNTVCPSSYAVASPSYYVGYTSLNVVSNANCGNNGIVSVYPEGQNNFTTWYSNNFSTGLLGPAYDASFGSTNFTGGLCNVTPYLLSQNGAFIVRNSAAINTNNLQLDFNLSTAPRGFAFNILGADGLCWSYGSDVTVGTVTTGGNGEGGSGTGLKLAFDATNNGTNNLPGAYLMFNCTVAGQGPGDPGVIAYKLGSWWQGLVNAPVSIVISQNGFVTVKVNNEVIFDHVALPASYLTSNKSNWIHSFTARTGGSNELHAIDDLNIRYNSYEYSNNSTTGLDGTWQSSNTFSGLAAGTYPMWVRNPSNPSCVSNVGNAVVGTSASPSSALTVAAPGFNTIICAGSSTDLTTDVSIPGAVFLWESSANFAGPYVPAAGTNNTGTYSTGVLLSNTYFRCTFTCPSSSPITSTPVLVTVNSGSITSTNSPQAINCTNDVATLTATPGANTTIVWYAASTGGSPLFAGNSYTVTPASLPATYYAEPVTTLFVNHYNFGGEKTVGGNLNGGSIGGTGISSKFNTSASVRIDSIKVLPNAAGTLTVALQNAGSATNILTFNQTITAAQVGIFVNVPVNFSITGSGNYQLTTTGISCSYNNAYPAANYALSYMNMGGVFSIVGGSTTPTGATSTSVYGTSYNWSITTSCPTGGARVPVVVNANPAYFVTTTPAASTFCANDIQAITASSSFAYSSYAWTPITNLYTDAAATIAYTAGTHAPTVYVKSTGSGNTTYTVSTALSGCTNTATATVNVNPGVTVAPTTDFNNICDPMTTQMHANAVAASSGATANNYSFAASSGTFTAITGGTATSVTATADEEISTTFPIGFSFNYAGTSYTTVQATSNGALLFGSGKTNSLTNDLATTTATLRPGVAPLWDDLQCSAGVTYLLTGSAGSRVLTVEWLNMEWYYLSSTSVISFQVKLYEANNNVQFVYRDEGNAPVSASASIGLMGTAGSDFLSLQNSGASPTTSTATSTNTISTKPATGQVYTFSPPVAALTYSWSPVITEIDDATIANPTVTALHYPGQLFTVTVTRANGCTATATMNLVALQQPPAPSITVTGAGVAHCPGFPTTLTASNDPSYVNYAWDNGGPNGGAADSYVINGATNTTITYTVTVTAATGCSSTQSQVVQVYDTVQPTITVIGSSNLCTGQTTSDLQADIFGATGPAQTYSWSTTETSSLITVSNGGTYSLTTSDVHGCVTHKSQVITESAAPAAPIVTPVGPINLCSSDGGVTYSSAILTVQNYGTDLLWSTSETTTSITVDYADIFNVTYTDPAGCYSVSNAVTTNALLASSDPTSATSNITTNNVNNICLGNNVILSVNGGSLGDGADWHWYEGTGACGTGTARGTGSSVTITPSTTGVHHYTVRAEGTCGPSNCSSIDITVSSAPPTGTISVTAAPVTGCNGTVSLVSVNAVSGATYYSWNGTSGALYSSSSVGPFVAGPYQTTGPSVYVQFLNPAPAGNSGYSICCFAANACGQSNTICTWVRSKVSQPGVISGGLIACASSSSAYSIAPVAGANTYTWTITGNANINGGGTTLTTASPSITVNFLGGWSSGTLSVYASLTCGFNSASRNLNIVNTPAIPGTMTGPGYVCPAGSASFSVSAVPGAASYNWTTNVPGAVITPAGNTASIAFPAVIPAGSLVCVTSVSSCGFASPQRCKSIASGIPNIPGVISGPASGQCGQNGVSYSITPVFGATSYLWSTSSTQATISGPNNLSAASVNFTSTFSSVTINVVANSACGSSAPRTLSVNGFPGLPAVISGNAAPCAGTVQSYSTTGSGGATSYNWTWPSGTTLVGGQGSNNLLVLIGSTAGNIGVTASNDCGVSGTRTFAITIPCRQGQVDASSGSANASLYPNPTSGKTTVKFESVNAAKYVISVVDVTGRVIISDEVSAAEGINMHELDLSKVAKGMYLVRIETAGEQAQLLKVTVE